MRRKTTQTMTMAVSLTLLSGLAMGQATQNRNDTERQPERRTTQPDRQTDRQPDRMNDRDNWNQDRMTGDTARVTALAEMVREGNTSLADAIRKAERMSNGTAIASRVMKQVRQTTDEEILRDNRMPAERNERWIEERDGGASEQDPTLPRDLNRDTTRDNNRDTTRTTPPTGTIRQDGEGGGWGIEDNNFDNLPEGETGERSPTRTNTRDGNQPATGIDRNRTNQPDRANDRANERAGANNRKTAEPELWTGSKAGYAVVTCVTDQGKVQDVVVSLDSGEVVGTRTASMGTLGNWIDDRIATSGWREGDTNWSNDSRNSGRDNNRMAANNSNKPMKMVRASSIIGADVINLGNEEIGDIGDLAINPQNGALLYGVLNRGGLVGIGESHYAIPADEFTTMRGEQIVLDLDANTLANRQGFSDSDWPLHADKSFDTNSSDESSYPENATRIVRATKVIGSDLKNAQGETLGEIDDIVVDPNHSRVTYLLVSADDGHIAVPMAACTITGDECRVKMDKAAFERLEAFNDRNQPNWNDQSWNRRAHSAFNVNPDWISVSSVDESGRDNYGG